MKPKQIATAGLLTAATLALGYVERFLPLDFGVTGIKPGIANIGVLITLYLLGGRWAVAVSFARVVLSGLLYAGVSSMMYSLAGAAAALAVMLILKRLKVFGIAGVSVGGAVAHICAQLCVATLWLGATVWSFSPWMMLSAVVTGLFNGAAAGLALRAMSMYNKR